MRSYDAEAMHERSSAMSTAKTLLAWLVSVLSGCHAALHAGSMLHSLIVLSNDPLASTSPVSLCFFCKHTCKQTHTKNRETPHHHHNSQERDERKACTNIEAEGADELGVGRDAGGAGLGAEVPDADGVVVAGGGARVAVGRPVAREHVARVAAERRDAAPGAQVPHARARVDARREREAAVALERDAKHRPRVPALRRERRARLDVPQPPQRVVARRREQPPRRVERDAVRAARVRARVRPHRLRAPRRPQRHVPGRRATRCQHTPTTAALVTHRTRR